MLVRRGELKAGQIVIIARQRILEAKSADVAAEIKKLYLNISISIDSGFRRNDITV
jgi:RNase P protein component